MRRFWAMLAVAALAGWASLAGAASTLDFGIVAPTAGAISYAGGDNPLVGTGIGVDNVVGLGTPSNDNLVLALTDATLSFTTGDLTASGANAWLFGGGGASTISIVGDIAALGLNDVVLMSGSFEAASVISFGGVFKIAGAAFFNDVNETLAAYYGLPGIDAWEGNFNISFAAKGTPPNAFVSTQLYSGDLVTSPVPIPGAALLLGSGLSGLFLFSRRKQG